MSARVREVLAGLAFCLGLVTCAASCGDVLRNIDEVNDPADDVALSTCRKAGRAALDGGTPEAAFQTYHDCTKDAGLR